MHPTAGGAFRSPLAGPPFNLGDTHIRWTRGKHTRPAELWRAIASELPGGESKSGGGIQRTTQCIIKWRMLRERPAVDSPAPRTASAGFTPTSPRALVARLVGAPSARGRTNARRRVGRVHRYHLAAAEQLNDAQPGHCGPPMCCVGQRDIPRSTRGQASPRVWHAGPLLWEVAA